MNVRIPQLPDLGKAIELYYARTELSTEDIKCLFGINSSARVARMKKLARELMVEQDIPYWNAYNVNTKAAYQAWGLNIKDLEQRYAKLKKLGLSNKPKIYIGGKRPDAKAASAQKENSPAAGKAV